METQDTDTTAVLDALNSSLDGVHMHTPVDRIVTAGRTRRRRRHLVRATTGVAALTALTLGVSTLSNPSTAPPETSLSTEEGSVHIHTVAFTLDSQTDGTLHVTWDKRRYFQDHKGLQHALRRAGFPVVIKEGVFCAGPHDDITLNASGVGPGVERVMKAQREKNDNVTIVFTPSAMPAGKQLFIGYLSPAQLAVTGGHPGSVERLISATDPLTCTDQAPPRGPERKRSENSKPVPPA
jgi:hypothetical protein